MINDLDNRDKAVLFFSLSLLTPALIGFYAFNLIIKAQTALINIALNKELTDIPNFINFINLFNTIEYSTILKFATTLISLIFFSLFLFFAFTKKDKVTKKINEMKFNEYLNLQIYYLFFLIIIPVLIFFGFAGLIILFEDNNINTEEMMKEIAVTQSLSAILGELVIIESLTKLFNYFKIYSLLVFTAFIFAVFFEKKKCLQE